MNNLLDLHIDDETLAELATAATTGEATLTRYLDEVQHLAACWQCAIAYDHLVDIMQTAVANMSHATTTVPPYEVLTTILVQDIKATTPIPLTASSRLTQTISLVVISLPDLLPIAPTTGEVDRILCALPPLTDISPECLKALTRVMHKNLPALHIYLAKMAIRKQWPC